MKICAVRRFVIGRSLSSFTENLTLANFVNGAYRRGGGNECGVESPSDGQVFASIRLSTQADVDEAVCAARQAQDHVWSKTTLETRARLLRSLAEALVEQQLRFAQLDSVSGGLCLRDSTASVQSSVRVLRQCADLLSRSCLGRSIGLSSIDCGNDPFSFTLRRGPVGTVGLITPFNYPLEMGIWKIAFALAAGNSVVWKPPIETPLSGALLASVAHAVGIPPGVLNVVHGGRETGTMLCRHPSIGLIGFTGSTATGAAVQRQCAEGKGALKRCLLELGGSAPLLVHDSADLNVAVDIALHAFYHSGQSCTAVRRAYVPRSQLSQFLELIVQRLLVHRVGHALDPSVQQGPLINALALERALQAILAAVKTQGSKVVCGAFRIPQWKEGYYMAPTVVVHDEAHHDEPLVQDEHFAPLLIVIPYSGTWSDAIRLANASPFGLSCNVVAVSEPAIEEAMRALEAGTVWVNGADVMDGTTPFGGWKQSGFGKDLGLAGLSEYTTLKTVIGPRATMQKLVDTTTPNHAQVVDS